MTRVSSSSQAVVVAHVDEDMHLTHRYTHTYTDPPLRRPSTHLGQEASGEISLGWVVVAAAGG